jgi:hypothetical protein
VRVTGQEPCCILQCDRKARWTRIDGEPAWDHYTDLCDRHKDELAGSLHRLIPGQEHPCLSPSAAANAQSELLINSPQWGSD